jgi:uncharacterized protein (DUF4415 family)
MPKTIKTKSGRALILPTSAENRAINRAVKSDPDAYIPTDREWKKLQPLLRRGRPKAAVTKDRITIRLSPPVLRAFRATGRGWQTRMDLALQQWLKNHRPAAMRR